MRRRGTISRAQRIPAAQSARSPAQNPHRGAECAGLNPAANRNGSNRTPRSMHARNRVGRMRTHRCGQIANRARWAQNAGAFVQRVKSSGERSVPCQKRLRHANRARCAARHKVKPGAHAFGHDALGSMKCAARYKAGRATHSCGTVGKVSGTKKPPGAECAGLNPAANRNRSNRALRSMHARNRVVRMRTHRCDQIANRARWAQNAGTRDRSDGTWRGRCCSPRNCGASLSNGHWRGTYLSAGGSALCGNVSVLFSKG